jgi:RNA polymerase sigma-70 factor, ECF subfamily
MNPSTESIWSEYSHQLKAYILKRIPDSSFADDILQDVFIKIHEKIDSLKDHKKINSWIYQITKNSIIDYYRKQKIKLSDIQLVSEKELNALEAVDSKTERNPEERIASGLKVMIDSLPNEYAQALNLVEFQGLSQVQLAKELNISVSGAKSRVQRGRQMLKDSLMKCCHYEFDKYGTIISSHPIRCCCCHQDLEHRKN